MRLNIFAMAVLVGCLTAGTQASAQSPATGGKLVLWYDEPASEWYQALPIGNGRLGAMIHGHPAQDVFYLNEDTVWSGGPHNYTNIGSHQYLEQLRQLIRDEKYDEAAEFGSEHSLVRWSGEFRFLSFRT